ncbi:MAG: VWA domain-containing protein [Chloroflexota bacterium]|nr:VWA domain-containing protein [Chloroflexota bacterium]
MRRLVAFLAVLVLVAAWAPGGAPARAQDDEDAEATIAALQTQIAELEDGEEAATEEPRRRSTPTPGAEDDEEATEEPEEERGRAVNVELILDVSGSMAQATDTGDTRMEAAKQVLRDVVDGIPDREGINVGFRVYGHEGDNTAAGQDVSCESSDLVVPLDGVDKDALEEEIDVLQPTGWTPIALSLERAGEDFEDIGVIAANFVVLVTDGLETCGGDPCEVAGDLHDGGLAVTTSVVGFGLTPDEQATIACIAEEGGGDVLGAANAAELSAALFEVLSTPVPDIQTPTPAPRVADPGTRENPIAFGSAADIGGGWFVSVVDVMPDATDLVLAENQFNVPPEEGYQFFLVTISATYEGEGSSVLPFGAALSLVGESAVSYKQFDPGCRVVPNPVPPTEVFSGGRIEGNLCWSVQTEEVDSLVMFSEDYVEFDRERRVWFSLDPES